MKESNAFDETVNDLKSLLYNTREAKQDNNNNEEQQRQLIL